MLPLVDIYYDMLGIYQLAETESIHDCTRLLVLMTKLHYLSIPREESSELC